MHFPYHEAFGGWWKRELPYRLLRAHRKLRCLFGPIGSETAEYLELMMDNLEMVFSLGTRLSHLADRVDPDPIDLDGVAIKTAVWPRRATSALWLQTDAYRIDVVYRMLMRQHAEDTGAMIKFEFTEHALIPVVQHIAIPRLRLLYREQTDATVCDIAAHIVGEQLLFDCWFMLQGVAHPLMHIGQHLRRYGALPLIIDQRNTIVILVAKPPKS